MEDVKIRVEAQDAASDVFQNIGNAGIALGATMVGIVAAGIVAATAALIDFGQAAAEAQESQVRFNSLVKSSSLAGFTDEMERLAATLSKTTRFEDENILEAEAMLATYDTIGKEVFPQVLEASLDLAEFMKTDATSAAQTLGRAFADIAGGSLSLIRRSRLLTAEQLKEAEAMAKAGDAAGAQAYVLDILHGKIGSLAEDMAGTFAGQWEIFQNTIGDMKEELGSKLLPIFTPLISHMTTLAVQILPLMSNAMDKFVIPSLQGMASALEGVFDWIEQFKMKSGDLNFGGMFDTLEKGFADTDWTGLITDAIKNLGDFAQVILDFILKTDWGKIATGIIEAMKTIKWQEVLDAVIVELNKMDDGINTFFQTMDWVKVGHEISDGLILALQEIEWERIGTVIGTALRVLADILAGYYTAMWIIVTTMDWGMILKNVFVSTILFARGLTQAMDKNIMPVFRNNMDQMVLIAKNAFATMLLRIKEKLAEIVIDITLGITNMIQAFVNATGDFISAGEEIVKSIQTGIENNWNSFVAWITQKIKDIAGNIIAGLTGGTGGQANNQSLGFSSNNVVPRAGGGLRATGAQARGGGGIRQVNNIYGPVTLKLAVTPELLKVR